MACEEGWNLQAQFNRALKERMKAEDDLAAQNGETFSSRWNRFQGAVERWQNAIRDRCMHVAECPHCDPNPPQ